MIKKLVIGLLLIVGGTLWSATPQLYLSSTSSETLGAGSSDTLTIATISLAGDSVGVLVELTLDSLSGDVRYQYTSPNSYTDTTQFANLPILLTIPNNSKGNFSAAIPVKAGAYNVRLYVIIKNNKATLQTFTRNIYTIIWR